MKRLLLFGPVLALVLAAAACGGSGKNGAAEQSLQHQADISAIDGIERTWHKAASTHDVDLMMSIWADDATFTIGTETLTGTTKIRNFFVKKAGPFQPENHWVSDTPAYKTRITASGNKGTLYFECDYIDVKTKQVVSVVAADQDVEKINGKWVITSAAASLPTLKP